ncbi:MAG: sensor domain-containing diguanylate cyclase, partial [Thermoleophilia bacterium]
MSTHQISRTERTAYAPEQSRPFQANLARAITSWSLLAGLLVLSVLGAAWVLGLRDPPITPPLVSLAAFFLALTPVARYLDAHEGDWDTVRDRRFAGMVVLVDIVVGTLVLFWTGGPSSVLIILVPLIPFGLRLLGNIWYSVAYGVAVAAALTSLVLAESFGLSEARASLLDSIMTSHEAVTGLLVFTVTAATASAIVLADGIARILRRREAEALAFSEKMNVRAEKLALLLRVGGVLSRAADFEEATNQALGHIHTHFHADATVLYVKEPQTGLLTVVQAQGDGAEREIGESTLALTALGTREAQIWPSTVPGETGARSAMVAPLLVEGTGYGAIKVVAPQGETFNRSKLALLETIASELASTMRTASTYESTNADLSRATAELAALNTFTRVVSSSFDLEDICRNLFETAMRVTNSDYGNVTILARGEQQPAVSIFMNYDEATEARLRTTRWRRSTGLYGRALRTGRPVVANDVRREEDYVPVVPDVLSKLCVPIMVAGHAEGMINLENRTVDTYSPGDVDFIAALAESASIAVKNARLYRTVEQSAIRDGLTGLYNHSYFHQALSDEMERALRYGREASLVLLDVDDFKRYNDDHGHLAGAVG